MPLPHHLSRRSSSKPSFFSFFASASSLFFFLFLLSFHHASSTRSIVDPRFLPLLPLKSEQESVPVHFKPSIDPNFGPTITPQNFPPSQIPDTTTSPHENRTEIELLRLLPSNGAWRKKERKKRKKPPPPRPFQKSMAMAWKAGRKAWAEVELRWNETKLDAKLDGKGEVKCPRSILMKEEEMKEAGNWMKLPCGMEVGSSITVIGVPRPPHFEKKPSIGHIEGGAPVSTEVSQFMLELHVSMEGEREEEEETYRTKILHINPRLKGDWSDKPVIELNRFLKGQWGTSQRCDGTPSSYFETVEGLPKCERWQENDDNGKNPSWWLNRLIEKIEKPNLSWNYPFSQNRSFIMTIRAGLEGYHISVDGKHVSSFPYNTGFLEDVVAGCFVGGDVDVQAMIATSLPSTPPKSINEKLFENWKLWRAPKLRDASIDLFIGVLSAADHFVERLAIRSAWFQSEQIKTGKVVARFFTALHLDKNINLQMKKEAEYYGDMVILPFIDDYSLVVLKTLAICKYGVYNVSTSYIMKCDDDTFVRVDGVLNELRMVNKSESLYLGNMNMYHRPLRTGKWAVSFEEWPDETYPTYANGPGYVISADIAKFVMAQRRKKTLELFKMEDVSMGLWVRQFELAHDAHVQYANMWKFYTAKCEDGYIVAHYQSPRQMLCLHEKVLQGDIHCCN